MDSATTMNQGIVQSVRRWFDIAGQTGGPLLPDGWFGGRPYENIFFLEDVHSIGNVLVIQLSEDTTLRISGPVRTFIEESDLVFDGFDHATLRWRHTYGVRTPLPP